MLMLYNFNWRRAVDDMPRCKMMFQITVKKRESKILNLQYAVRFNELFRAVSIVVA